MPPTHDNNSIDRSNHGGTSTAEKSGENNNAHRKDEESLWRKFAAYLYESIVNFVACFIADVVSHPRLLGVFVDMVVSAINTFMEQDDIGTKLDHTARKVLYDTEKARQASKDLGKEVVPMVTGFVSGMASSLKPSSIKRRKMQRKDSKVRRERDTGRSTSTVSDMTNSQGYHTSDVGEEVEEAKN